MKFNNTASSTCSRNGALDYSTRSVDNPARKGDEDADGALTEFLRSRGREGFASSAYWGVTGEVPPRDPDDVAADAFGFRDEIDRRLVRFPKDKTSFPRTTDYTLIGMHLVGVTPNGDNGGLNAAQLLHLQASGDAQVADDGSGGLRVNPRLLNTLTSTQRMRGDFGGPVQQALRDGRAREEELLRQLQAKRTTPFATADPDPYRVSSDDYCDFSRIEPRSSRVTEVSPATTGTGGDGGAGGGTLEVYRSRYNSVERDGPKRRERTFKEMQRGRTVDRDQLRTDLGERTKRTMPHGWQGYSAKDWLSTTHREHAPYDVDAATAMNDREATVPLRNTHYQLSADDEMAVTQRDERYATRHTAGEDGQFNTEYADKYQDRFDQAEVRKDFAGKSVFDIKFGVYTMDHHFHHPRDDVHTVEKYSPAGLVPGQYTTMYKEPLHARNNVGDTTLS